MKTKMGKTRVSIEIYQPYLVVHLTAVLCLFIRMRKDELNAISGPNEFAEFYNRLKQIKEFHRKHPNEVDCRASVSLSRTTQFCLTPRVLCPFQICVPMSVEFEELMKAKDNPSEEAQSKSGESM